MKKLFPASLVACALMVPGAAMAQDDATWSVDGGVQLASDYRFRGISLSDKDPAVSADVTISHGSGFYAGAWASNVTITPGSDDLEVDFIAGWSGDLGPLTTDLKATYLVYPGNEDLNYLEVSAGLGASIGVAQLSTGVAYAPPQDALGDEDSVYAFVAASAPLVGTPLSLHGSFGVENGAFGNYKRDWQLGATYPLAEGIEARVDYIDTARAFSSAGDATALFTLSVRLGEL